MAPSFIPKENKGVKSLFYKATVIGERLSPYVGIICMYYGFKMLKETLFG